MNKRKKIRLSLLAIVLLALGILVPVRWKAWFYNPEEPPYTVSNVPVRVLLTFGNDGELSRYVSWMCDTTVHDDAELLLACDGDTTTVKAVGEVFESRAGKAAYYRSEIKSLKANKEYGYAAKTNGVTSQWYHFHTSNPDSLSFSFLFMGDVQDTIDGKANIFLRNAIRRHPDVEFVAFGGDLTERPMDKYWAETFRSIDSVCTAMPVVNITGNHDYLKYLIRKCERRFALVFPYFLKGMDERNDENHLFKLRYHNTDIYMLDSDRGAYSLYKQRQWLAEELSNSKSANHRIVMLHHPLYSVKKKNNNLIQRWMFNNIIKEEGVELVLQGHEHGYARCTSEDVPLKGNVCRNPPLYTVSHCSPKNYNLHPAERFAPVLSDSRYYQIIDVKPDAIVMKGYDANNGKLIDSVKIIKNKAI